MLSFAHIFAFALLLSSTISVLARPAFSRRADPKAVFVHYLVGNTYGYTVDKWSADIQLAQSKAVDVFALNVGRDSWQPAQTMSAYNAAVRVAPAFKMSISLDMNSLPCQTTSDGQYIIDNFISPFKAHSQRYLYNNKTFLSTFAGQQCLFGQASAPAGWQWLLKTANTSIYFIPNIQIGDATKLSTDWSFIDGYKLWNAWPQSQTDNTQWNDDAWWMQNVGSKGYLTLVSPWFFIHLSVNTADAAVKQLNNRYFRGDNFMYRARWSQLIQRRDSLSFIEVASWNDYGESHYIGPRTGTPPSGANYVTAQTDHQAWADYTAYYATWFKLGASPAITTDRVYLWARPQPKLSSVCGTDGVGQVTNAEWADDLLFASVFLASPAQASCHSGSNSTGARSLPAGISELTVPLAPGGVGCTITRNGATVIRYEPSEYNYTLSPTTCNMNAWTGMMQRAY